MFSFNYFEMLLRAAFAVHLLITVMKYETGIASQPCTDVTIVFADEV